MLRPDSTPTPIPEDTRRVAQAAFPKGNVNLWIRDEFEQLYQDEDFADLYPVQGQPSWSAWRLALVCVMQFMEDLTDRQAADAVRGRIDWKYALGLPLSDSGFDFSVLSEFRTRLLKGEAESRLLERVLVRLQEKGWLSRGGKQRTDSTHVVSTIHERRRLEALHETLRASLNTLAEAEPAWLQAWVPAEWYERYGRAVDDYHLPQNKAQRTVYSEQLGADGLALLAQLWQDDAPRELRKLASVEHLRRYWVHHFYVDPVGVHLRPPQEMSAVSQRADSPYDPESRYGNKGSTQWHGYKVHVSETCDPEQVHVITHVETTSAYVQDIEQTATIHAALAAKGLLPKQHFVDAGYTDAELLVSSQKEYGVELIGPIKADPSWQAKDPEAYDAACFTIDWANHTVTCPQGHTSKSWSEHDDAWHNAAITVNFSKSNCRDCPVRACCTRSLSYPRSLTLHPQAQQEALQQRRIQQTTQSWWQHYHTRAGIEGTISQAVSVAGLRQTRYRGLAKTRFQHIASAVALNLKRLFAWVNEIPHAKTRISRFAALKPQAA